MIRKLKEHPEYPFSEENLEATVREMERFLSEPPLSTLERGEVLEFVRLTRQYAFLERLIQGEILFELPVHLDLGEASVEALAAPERELLGLGAVPGGELIDALDERGIKVFRRRRGPNLRIPSREGSSTRGSPARRYWPAPPRGASRSSPSHTRTGISSWTSIPT